MRVHRLEMRQLVTPFTLQNLVTEPEIVQLSLVSCVGSGGRSALYSS